MNLNHINIRDILAMIRQVGGGFSQFQAAATA